MAQSKQEKAFGDSCLKLPMMVCLTAGNTGVVADDDDDLDVEEARIDDNVSRKEVGIDDLATREDDDDDDDDASGSVFGLS